MNFMKRAWQNITYKKGRSLLLIIVISVIMLFIMAGLLIRNAAVTTIDNTKNQMGANITLSADRQKAFEKMRSQDQSESTTQTRTSLDLPSVSLKTVKKIAKMSQVKNYNVSVSASVNAASFDAISTSSQSMGGGPGGMESSDNSGDITVSGVDNMASLSDFKKNSSKITSGRALTSDDAGTNNVVIESQLAKSDNLKVGQTIKVKITDSSEKSYELKIVGIYKASSAGSSSMQMGRGPGQSDPSNTIYTSYTLANKFKGQTDKVDSATFVLNDPTQKSTFLKEAKKEINSSKFSITADDSTYQQLKQSMKQMVSFSDKIVWLVAIAGTIILALIIILMIRERRYEMGVLLSMGESKAKIIGQLLVEMLMLLVVSLVIAGIGGKYAGQAVSKQVMTQISTNNNNSTDNMGPGGAGRNGAPSMPGRNNNPGGSQMTPPGNNKKITAKNQDLKLKISPLTLIQLGAFGFTIIAFATLLSSINILRLEPRKILIG